MKDCHICLEEINSNSCKFCCGEYHIRCILQAIRITGKCPLCRFEYKLYKNKITDNINNLDQIQYICISHLKEENDIIRAHLHNLISDFSTRLSAIEMYNGQAGTPNSVLNNHSIRINRIELDLDMINRMERRNE